MAQECDCMMLDVLFERDGLQVRLDSTASQLWLVHNLLTAERQALEHLCGRSATSHWPLESFLVSLDSGFVEMEVRLLS